MPPSHQMSISGADLTQLRCMLSRSRDILKVASLLVKNGADPNSRDDLGRAPLHRLSHGGPLVMAQSSLEVARLLVNSGADASVTDDEGRTPLHLAARRGYRDVVELSLESGASLDVRAMDIVTHGLCEWEA
jgi:ankyrin